MESPTQLARRLKRGRRGRKAIPINAENLLALFQSLDGSRAIRCEGIPPDAEIERVEVDSRSGQIVLVIRSALFAPSLLATRMEWLVPRFNA